MYSRNAIKPLNCKALLRLPRRCIPMDTIHRMRHLKAPRGLNHGRTSRSAYERALVQDEPLFVNDIEATRCVLLAPHRIPLKEFTSLRKKPEDRGGLFPVWGYPWYSPITPRTNPRQKTCSGDGLGFKRTSGSSLLPYVLDQRVLRIEFAHLIAKRQLHTVLEGLRQQSKSGAQGERGYGSVNPGTPRTTYAPAVADPRSQQPSGSQPGAGLPAPTSSVTRGNPATLQAADASQSAAAFERPAPHGSGARRSDQGGREEPTHAFDYEAPSQPYPSGPSTSGQDSVGPLLATSFAASPASKPEALEVLRRDLDALGRETHELHGRVDRRVPAAALKELRRRLDALSHEVHGRMPSYEPQGYSYHSDYGYSSYPSSSHSVQSYPSYDSRGYQPVYQSQASPPAAPVVQRTQPRFEDVSSHLGLPPSEKEDPADRDTA
ncbi:ATP-binding cassette (ABC) Superfamily [Phytophthora palmivora]|uniref:ATP-binding cassette (ABC) Superfamily n=1 Tax=Phytophthora palmivora TaxID=4796 RepID=A0A2P4XBE9_9STRA|nr:ATP-binding cassette (ABC) Superfamily [Phytophthora palmivora]